MNISRFGFIIVAAFALGMFAGRAGGLDEARFSQPLPYDLGLTVARPDSQVNIDRDSLAELIAEVPCKEYCRAYVTCAADPDPKRDRAFTVRLTRHVTGPRKKWLGRSYSAMADTLVELDAAKKVQVGWVDLQLTTNNQQLTTKVPLWRVEVPLRTADIHDIVFTDMRGDHLDRGRYLDLELMGRCWKDPVPGYDQRLNVDPHYMSAVTVYKVELEDTPCEVEFKPIEPGNVFHNDEKPETRVELRVKEPGEYRLSWTIRDVAGKLVNEDSIVVSETGVKTIALANDGIGWYSLDWELSDGRRTLLTHTASFAVLGKDTRQSKQGEGYGIWPPFSGHYRPDVNDPVEREIGLKLVHKAGFRRVFDSARVVPLEERRKYKIDDVAVARFPSDWWGGKRDEAKMKEVIAKRLAENPACNKAMVYHESYPHPGQQSIECFGGDTNQIKEAKGVEGRLKVGLRAAKFLRENFPEVKIMVGNSIASSAFISELIRHGYPESYADFIGLEVVGEAALPEFQLSGSLQAAECMVETARHYGYKWGVTQCFESNFRLDKLIGPERQAEWYVRDLLIGHCWRFDDLFVAGTVAAGNHYTTTVWGDSDICNRMPWCYPKPSYVALATATKVMDCIRDREILDTGDKTVYAVRLVRGDGKSAYALWTSRGTAKCEVKTKGEGEEVGLIDLYGRALKFDGTVRVGEAVTYLIADKPVVSSVRVMSRAYPKAEIPSDWRVVAKADSADDWEIVPGELPMVEHKPNSGEWPARVAGKGVVRTVKDAEKGEALEIELVEPDLSLKPLVAEYAFAKLRKPVKVESPFASIGLWMKGNSGWGEVYFVLRDAKGRRTVSCETGMQGKQDHTARMVACYSGWNFCTFPVLQSSSVPELSSGLVSWSWTGGAPVKFPVTVEGVVFSARSRPLFLSETAKAPYRQAIRIRDVGVFDFNRPIEAPANKTYYDDNRIVLKTPAVGATDVNPDGVVFTWEGDKEPPFVVTVAEVLSGKVVHEETVRDAKTFTVRGLKPDTVYTWRVYCRPIREATGTFRTWKVPKADGWGREDVIEGKTDREIPVYGVGEPITMTFSLRGFKGLDAAKCAFDWTRTGDDGKTERGKAPADRPLVLTTSLDRPGFVRYYVELVDDAGKPVERLMMDDEDNRKVRFDGGAGVDVFSIRQGVPPPEDLDAFWAKMKDELARTPWQKGVRLEKLDSGRKDVDLYAVTVPCPGGRPATGFLSIPTAAKAGKRFPADVSFYGYNGSWSRFATEKPAPERLQANVVQFFSSAHGFELMRECAYYRSLRESCETGRYGYAFDPAVNADPAKAYFRGMAFRVLRGLEFLKSRPEWDGKNLIAHGGSMGGLQTIWAAAFDPDVTVAKAEVPWCCDIGGETVGRNRGDWYVRWVPGLGYYDPVNLAKYVRPECVFEIPRVGLGDYVCPPTGVMAFYNNLKCASRRAVLFQNSRHGYVAPRPFQAACAEGNRLSVSSVGAHQAVW